MSADDQGSSCDKCDHPLSDHLFSTDLTEKSEQHLVFSCSQCPCLSEVEGKGVLQRLPRQRSREWRG